MRAKMQKFFIAQNDTTKNHVTDAIFVNITASGTDEETKKSETEVRSSWKIRSVEYRGQL